MTIGKYILLSTREISTIIKINDVYNTPKLDYILTFESLLEGRNYQEYNYSKPSEFASHAG